MKKTASGTFARDTSSTQARVPSSFYFTMMLSRTTPTIARGFAPRLASAWSTGNRSYHDNIVEHYENPRNVGSFDKKEEGVGTVRMEAVDPHAADISLGANWGWIFCCLDSALALSIRIA